MTNPWIWVVVVHIMEVLEILDIPLAAVGELVVDEVGVAVGTVWDPVVHFVQDVVAVLLPDPLLSFPSLSCINCQVSFCEYG